MGHFLHLDLLQFSFDERQLHIHVQRGDEVKQFLGEELNAWNHWVISFRHRTFPVFQGRRAGTRKEGSNWVDESYQVLNFSLKQILLCQTFQDGNDSERRFPFDKMYSFKVVLLNKLINKICGNFFKKTTLPKVLHGRSAFSYIPRGLVIVIMCMTFCIGLFLLNIFFMFQPSLSN